MKKIKYNPRIVKKTILFSILAILVIWFGVTVIISFIPSYSTTDSGLLKTSIPAGEYKNYLLDTIGFNSDKYSDYDENGEYSEGYYAFHETLQSKQPQLSDPIYLGYEDAEITEGGDNFYKGKIYTTSTGESAIGYYTDDNGSLTWNFDVDEAGFYYILLDYFVPAVNTKNGSGSNAERAFYINGNELFDSLASVSFSRVYCDDEESQKEWKANKELKKDLVGNNLKPSQVEIENVRVKTYLQDQSGYVENPYLIYFEKGENTLTIKSIRESLVVCGIEIHQTSDYEVLEYEDYYAQYGDSAIVNDAMYQIEAEDSVLRKSSSPTLYPIADRNSSANYPNDPVRQKYNAIGGSKWTNAGDWLSWDVTVEKAGLYNITFRSKQDQSRGLFTTRKLLVNDELPFKEAANCRFYYSSKYQITTLGYVDDNGDDQPFYVYLNEGVNTIKLQATIGDYSDLISQVQVVVDDLNDLYLRIISITTPNPDDYQDYKLQGGESSRLGADEKGRYMEDIFSESAIILNNVSKQLAQLSGEKSTFNSTLDELVIQIGGIVDGKDVGGFATNPRNVTKDLSEFKSNLSSLGTWILDIKSQSLTIESLYVHSANMKSELPHAEDNWFVSTWFGIRGFFMSFFYDYEAVGKTVEDGEGEEIEVWYLTDASSGREQANAIKSLIDQTFIQETQINVILKVVAASVLLPATLAGTGPDVAINADGGLPVNYALRNAVYDMSKQPDFEEVIAERFTSDQIVPFSLMDANGNTGVYGLPNTMSFYVMFYRTDIFKKNGWQVPTTWDEVIDLVTDMQVSNLDFYLPLEGDAGTMFAILLYQNGGQYYTDDQTKTAFDDEVSLQSFEQWCSFFTDYSFELSANFSNRFRSGEMPIGISSYTLFNTLSVFAPDIAGKWEFAALPGVERVDEDGNKYIDNSTILSQTAVIIMNQGDDFDYTNAWEFVKWWTREDTQTSYAKEMESILGAAARHNTANRYAVENLAWSSSEIKIITEMWDTGKAIPGVPGGYYIGRNLENSIRAVINNDENPRETFKEYIEQINAEITRKRNEFGLPTA